MPYAAVTRYCNGMLVAVNLPPTTGATITRPAPDLLSLMDATSNSGLGAAADWPNAWQELIIRPANAEARSIPIGVPYRVPRRFCTMKPEEIRRVCRGFVRISRSIRVSLPNTCGFQTTSFPKAFPHGR